MIENLLTHCGLKESEQKVLIFLLRHGPSLASLIAKYSGLKRPTAYAVLENLLRIGVISKQRREGMTYFSALEAEMIPKVLENRAFQKFKETEQAIKLLEKPLTELTNATMKDFGGYMISSVESTESIYAELEAALLAGDFCAFFNPQVTILNEDVKKLIAKFLSLTAISKPHIREIIVEGPLTDWYISLIDNENHLVKKIPSNTKIFSDMIMANGSVLLCHYRPHTEVGIKITQKEFFTSMMAIFEMMWKR